MSFPFKHFLQTNIEALNFNANNSAVFNNIDNLFTQLEKLYCVNSNLNITQTLEDIAESNADQILLLIGNAMDRFNKESEEKITANTKSLKKSLDAKKESVEVLGQFIIWAYRDEPSLPFVTLIEEGAKLVLSNLDETEKQKALDYVKEASNQKDKITQILLDEEDINRLEQLWVLNYCVKQNMKTF